MKKIITILVSSLIVCSYTYGQSVNDSAINNFIKEWIGGPYRYGGKTKKGIDCSAFTQRFYKDVYGVSIPRTCRTQYNYLLPIKLEDLMVGDVLFFNSKMSPSGWHCGIYIGQGEFIHAANARDGIKISCLYDEMYGKLFKGGGRYLANIILIN